ncbi:MAG: cytochrome c [Terracidiphilus sp.]|jgi:mono/diheme cytochrome c family protein
MGRVFFGFLLGFLLVPVGVGLWAWRGHVPVAVADSPFPQERQIAGMILDARIQQEMAKTSPITVDETNLVAGAHIYSENCAVCHGLHGKPSIFGAHMFPEAPPLWEKHPHGGEMIMGVTDDPLGETYWKVANGIRLTGMPAFKDTLTETDMWQVTVLLGNADKPLPPAAVEILRGEPAPPEAKAPATKN